MILDSSKDSMQAARRRAFNRGLASLRILAQHWKGHGDELYSLVINIKN